MTTTKSSDNAKSFSPNHLLRGVLMPAAVSYGAGNLVRVLAYASGVIPRYKARVPVVSVGNLTVGGTGKTPVAIDLAKRFVAAGFKPAVLSRGYKRKSNDAYVVVSDGETILASCEDAGDEPYLIAASAKGAVVIVGAKRSETAEIACREHNCDLLILDDGFQHLPILRDVDIVLIDYHDDIENDLLLPAGRLREPLGALARASSVVITKVPHDADRAKLERISQVIHKHNASATIGLVRFAANKLVAFDDTKSSIAGLSTVTGMTSAPGNAVAFCGLARPDRFFQELRDSKIPVVHKLDFSDHHWYTAGDASKLNGLARKHNADAFITTEKDIVKFSALRRQLERPLIALGLTTEWVGTLPVAVEELLANGPSKK